MEPVPPPHAPGFIYSQSPGQPAEPGDACGPPETGAGSPAAPARPAGGWPAPLPPRPGLRHAESPGRLDPAVARSAGWAGVAGWLASAAPGERDARQEAARRIDRLADPAAGGRFALDLKGLGLTSLPDLRSCGPCSTLDLDGNALAMMPALPERLTRLSVAGNALHALPRLPHSLLHLNVSGNRLAALPPLPSGLESLDAADNRLTRLPPLPRSLERLVVRGNRLPGLPDLGEHRFRHLDIADNLLRDLPHSIGEHACNRIGTVDLSGNPWHPASLERIALLTNRGAPRQRFVMRDLEAQRARSLAGSGAGDPEPPPLPDDTLRAIFRQAEYRSLGALRATGRGFRTLTDETVATARPKSVRDLPRWVAAFPNVRQVELTAGEAHDDELRTLQAFPNLRGLRIDLDALQDRHLRHLGALARLETLDIVGRNGVGDAGLAHLRALTGLRSLRLLECTAITDRSLATLARLPDLRHLYVSYCQSMQFDALPDLDGMPALRDLTLQYNHPRSARLPGPGQFPLLERIELAGAAVPASAFAAFARAPRPALRRLCVNDCPTLHESAFARLAGLSGLHALDLHGTCVANAAFHELPDLRQLNLGNGPAVSAATLAGIGTLRHLTELTGAGSPHLTDDTAAHLARLQDLERLDLRAAPNLGNAGLALIAGNRNLTYLRVNANDRIDSTGVARLAALPRLRELDLARCQNVDDDAILHLSGLAHLEKLTLTGCRNVSYAGRCALRETRPALEIVVAHVRPPGH